MDKQTLIRNFSRNAHLYDDYAQVQKQVAAKLLREIKEGHSPKILEIGCGTGNYTLILRKKFRNAKIRALDICPEMVAIAKAKLKNTEVEFMIADAESVNLEESFNLVTSNACFQWFADLEAALLKYKGLLKSKGRIAFSIFGPQTFPELSRVLKYTLPDNPIEAHKFKTLDDLKEILEKNFAEVKIKEIKYTESFSRLKDLLKKIKYTGVRGNGTNGKILFNQKLLDKLEQSYLDKFKGIKATYQVFLCLGKKR